MMLLRTQPDRYAIFGWLRVIAIREAYRLSSIEQREATLEPARLDGREPGDAGDSSGLDTAVEALEALRAVAALPPRQRSDLTLKVAGYSYEEIRNAHRQADLHERQQVPRQGAGLHPALAAMTRVAPSQTRGGQVGLPPLL
jgi:hypothetical protein